MSYNLKKKLSRTECLRQVETRQMSQVEFDDLETKNLMTGSGRTFNSRVIENVNGKKVMFNPPSYRTPGGRKNGGGITCRKPEWSVRMDELIKKCEDLWIEYSEPHTRVVITK